MTVECEIDSIFKIELIRKWETRNGQMWNDIGSATNHCERKTARLMNAAECALFDQRMLFTFVHNSKETTRSFDSIENKTEWNEKKFTESWIIWSGCRLNWQCQSNSSHMNVLFPSLFFECWASFDFINRNGLWLLLPISIYYSSY